MKSRSSVYIYVSKTRRAATASTGCKGIARALLKESQKERERGRGKKLFASHLPNLRAQTLIFFISSNHHRVLKLELELRRVQSLARRPRAAASSRTYVAFTGEESEKEEEEEKEAEPASIPRNRASPSLSHSVSLSLSLSLSSTHTPERSLQRRQGLGGGEGEKGGGGG